MAMDFLHDCILASCFHADFGKEFPSRTLSEIATLQALGSTPRSTEQSVFRGGEKGEKVRREGEEEG